MSDKRTDNRLVMAFGRLNEDTARFELVYVERNPQVIMSVLQHLEGHFEEKRKWHQSQHSSEPRDVGTP